MVSIVDINNSTIATSSPGLIDFRPQISKVYFSCIKTSLKSDPINIADDEVFEFKMKDPQETLEAFSKRVGKSIDDLYEFSHNDVRIIPINLELFVDDNDVLYFPYQFFGSNKKGNRDKLHVVKKNSDKYSDVSIDNATKVVYISSQQIDDIKQGDLNLWIEAIKKGKTRFSQLKQKDKDIEKLKSKIKDYLEDEKKCHNNINKIKYDGYEEDGDIAETENGNTYSENTLTERDQRKIKKEEEKLADFQKKRKSKEVELEKKLKEREITINKIYNGEVNKIVSGWNCKEKEKHAIKVKCQKFDTRRNTKATFDIKKLDFITFSANAYLTVETIGVNDGKAKIKIIQSNKDGLYPKNNVIPFTLNDADKTEFEIPIEDFVRPSVETPEIVDEVTFHFRGTRVSYKNKITYENLIGKNMPNRKVSLLKVHAFSENDKEKWISYLGENKETLMSLNATYSNNSGTEIIYKGMKISPSDQIPNSWIKSDNEWFCMKYIPLYLQIAIEEIGQSEIDNDEENPRISQDYFGAVKYKGASDDGVPWCSAFINWCMDQGGLTGTKSAASLDWRKWDGGELIDSPFIGSLVSIDHGNSHGHVAFITGMEGNNLALLGGNQAGIGGGSKGVTVNCKWVEKKKDMVFIHPKGIVKIIPTSISVAPTSSKKPEKMDLNTTQ